MKLSDIPVAAEILTARSIIDRVVWESISQKNNPINVIVVQDAAMRDLVDPFCIEKRFPFGVTDGVYNGAYIIIGDRPDIDIMLQGMSDSFPALNAVKINWHKP